MGSDHFPIFVNAAGFHSRDGNIAHVINWDCCRELSAMAGSKMKTTTLLKVLSHFPSPDWKLKNLCSARRAKQQLVRKKGDRTLKTTFNN